MVRSGDLTNSGSPSPERVAELVQSLALVMRQTAITEIDLELGPLSVRLRRPALNSNEREASSALAAEESRGTLASNEHLITAPMIGTFHSSSTPGAAPFVSEGDEVFIGQIIGIIEAMKIMNEISADRAGTVESILVGNGQPVEYGSALLRLVQTGAERP